MKTKIVYFAYLMKDKWEPIVEEQLSSLKKLKLYDEAINIYMSVISDDEQLEKLRIFLKDNYPKVEINGIYKDNVYEYAGIKTLYKIAEDEDDIALLYFHSKGMTSNQHETRQYLFKYTIENYENYLNEFDNNSKLEVAGAIPHIHGFIYFNFFWVRSSYVRNWCSRPEVSDNRYIWEVWVGSEFSRKKEIITYSSIIKYDQVTNTDEVWNIHNRMIKNEYEPKPEIQQPLKVIVNVNKPTRIDSNKKYEAPKPVRIDTIKIKPEPVAKESVSKETIKLEPVAKDSVKEETNELPNDLYVDDECDECNPYKAFEKLKNKNHIVVEIGSGVGLNTYMLSKRFKKVVTVENEKSNIERLESNIRKFCHKNITLCKKRIVQVKDDLENCMTIKELMYYNIHKNFQTVNLVVCDFDGLDENIIEDLFHYCFHTKANLYTKFNIQNISKYNYLFNYYNYNPKLLNSNKWMIFEPKPEGQITKNNMSIVIIGYNQYTYISKMVKQLEPYTNDIIIIDNKSDYKPLLNYYEKEYKYSLLKMDKNHGHKVYEESFIISLLGNMYIITDPDLRFNKNLPSNFISEMVKVSNEYKAGRVGFALLIHTDDIRPGLSYAGMPIKEWEGRFWKHKIPNPNLELYSAPIDTTFCLLNMIHNYKGLSIRIAGDYVCKHLPWHHNYHQELLDDEYDHYLLNNRSTNFWVDKNKKKKEPETQVETFTRIPVEELDSDDEVELDEWIVNKVKNINAIAINIGSANINNFSNKFKFIMNVNNDICCMSDNILQYNKKIVNKKTGLNQITLKEFIYENTIYNQELKNPIKFINMYYDENLVEDVLHYAWINKCNVSIKMNHNQWNDSNKYLLKFFKIYENDNLITNINNCTETLLFIPNTNFMDDLYKKNMPVVIIGFNQPTYIKMMVKQLEPYTTDIIVIDNNSDFKPLLDYYEKEYKYTLFRMKKNYGHKVYEQSFLTNLIGDIFFITDPDLEFNKNLPNNFIENMIEISKHFQAEKVGFALEYDSPNIRKDIKAFGQNIYDWEKRYWTMSLYYPNHKVYSAAIDTTFCLVNKQNANNGHYRLADNYLCKHLPWYKGFEKDIPKDEFEHYQKNNVSTNYFK
jgi:hypothetical protein